MPTPIENAKQKELLAVHRAGAEDDVLTDQLLISLIYYNVEGVKNNKMLAYKWIIIFESNYINTKMYKELAKILMDMYKKELSPEDIAEAEKLAKEWIKINRDEWHENEMKKLQQNKP